MNESPPNPEKPDDIDDRYRRASAEDPGRPSERVRRAVFNHAAQLAAGRRSENHRQPFNWRAAVNRLRWRPAMVGTLAAAALAGLLITPYFLRHDEPRTAAVRPAPFSAPNIAVNASLPSTFPAQVQGMAKLADGSVARGESAVHGEPTARSARVAAGEPAPRGEVASGPRLAAPGSPAKALADGLQMPALDRSAQSAPAARMIDSGAALRQAAETGDLQGLRAALEARVDIEARDGAGRTALMLATLRRRAGAVDLLLAQGADPNAADARGMTPLQVAEASDQRSIIAALRRAGGR